MPKSRIVDEPCQSNPYIKKSISKTLLTPCRQVGLSRKRKFSNNLNKSSPQIESQDNQNTEESTIVTPTITTEFNENHHNDNNDWNEKSRKKVVRCLEMNENGNYKQLDENIEINKNQIIEDNLEVPVCEKKAITQTKKKQKSSRKTTKTSKIDNNQIKQNKETKSIETVKIDRNETRTPTLFDDDEDFVEDDKMQRIKIIKEKSKSYDQQLLNKRNNNDNCNVRELTVKLKRCDSNPPPPPPPRVYTNKKLETTNKEDGNNLGTDDDEVFYMKKKQKPSNLDEMKVLSSKNHQEISPELPKLTPISPIKKQKKINRSLSLKKTYSDEHESFDLSDDFMDENCPPPPPPLLHIDPGKIEELEREIIKKRECLENLQQTEIYKKLHNIDELKQLTEIWKTGCITALNDLLPRLKPYADIDMATLLEKLKVPEHLIKLSPIGELI